MTNIKNIGLFSLNIAIQDLQKWTKRMERKNSNFKQQSYKNWLGDALMDGAKKAHAHTRQTSAVVVGSGGSPIV